MADSVVPVPEAAVTLPPGTRLGKYQLVRRLGAGGMGTVYEAIHTDIGKHVAVKVLAPAVAAMEGARARFLREAQLTSKVRHMHAVDVTDMGTEGDHSFLVMELLAGEDLATRIGRGPVDPHELCDIVLAVCSAVVAAHRAGIIHRDLKPQNIFLAEGAHGIVPKVLDFGISKGLDATTARALTSTGAVLGTPYYLAPEQVVDNRTSSPLSDQYAIGIILYECLTSARPFEGESLFMVFQAIVAGSPVPPRQLRPELDPGLEAVVLRAIEVDPARRFPSVDDLGRALWPFAGERSRLLWRDSFGPQAGMARTPTRKPLAAETAVDPTPRSGPVTPARRPATPAAPPTPATPPMPVGAFTNEWRDAPTLRPSSSGRAVKVIGALVLIAGGVGAFRYLRPGGDGPSAPISPSPVPTAPVPAAPIPVPPAPRSYTAAVLVDPAAARIELDGGAAGTGRLERTFTADGTTHTLVISADGYETQTVSFRDGPPPARIALTARPPKVEAKRPAPRPARARRERAAPKEESTPPTPPPRPAPRPPRANPDDAPIVD